MKKNLHPKLYKANVFCDGKLILIIETTKKELYVDVWSGNHPLYTELYEAKQIENNLIVLNIESIYKKNYDNYTAID